MASLQQITMVFPVKASPRLLFTLVATAEGLQRWFADKVSKDDQFFQFEWEGSIQNARLIGIREPEFIKLEWDDDFHQGHILEIQISHEPVSGESALIITDCTEESDVEFTQMWWTTQVAKLQRLFNN